MRLATIRYLVRCRRWSDLALYLRPHTEYVCAGCSWRAVRPGRPRGFVCPWCGTSHAHRGRYGRGVRQFLWTLLHVVVFVVVMGLLLLTEGGIG